MSTVMTQAAGAAIDRYADPGMIQTLKDTVAKGSTDSQFRMFIEVCRATGLNPFLKEIWFVPSVGVMAGRDGYLRVANDHPMFDGMETVVERNEQNIPIKATCSVWRKDRAHPIKCEAYYSEYKKAGQVWNTYPSAMISKVAEVLALKRSFSINGVVTEEEIGAQAEDTKTRVEKIADAQAVATRKIAELTAGAPVVHDAQFVEPEAPQDEPQPAQATKVSADKFKALAAFKDLKKEIITQTGSDSLYYQWMGGLGYEKSNQIENEKLRDVYRIMAAELVGWKKVQPPVDERPFRGQ